MPSLMAAAATTAILRYGVAKDRHDSCISIYLYQVPGALVHSVHYWQCTSTIHRHVLVVMIRQTACRKHSALAALALQTASPKATGSSGLRTGLEDPTTVAGKTKLTGHMQITANLQSHPTRPMSNQVNFVDSVTGVADKLAVRLKCHQCLSVLQLATRSHSSYQTMSEPKTERQRQRADLSTIFCPPSLPLPYSSCLTCFHPTPSTLLPSCALFSFAGLLLRFLSHAHVYDHPPSTPHVPS